jgi:hypothetical protein
MECLHQLFLQILSTSGDDYDRGGKRSSDRRNQIGEFFLFQFLSTISDDSLRTHASPHAPFTSGSGVLYSGCALGNCLGGLYICITDPKRT